MAQTMLSTMSDSTLDEARALYEIKELAKVVGFRDTIYSGLHAKFKVPSSLARKASTSSDALQRPWLANHSSVVSTPGIYQESKTAAHSTASPSLPRASNGVVPVPTASTNSCQIDPVLLAKSDGLVKAELQLRRQRLEKALREQVEQQRLKDKAALTIAESLPDFDLSEVLLKALSIVRASGTASEVVPLVGSAVGAAHIRGAPSAGARSPSDSFDENTFYSSQHDTPEPSSPFSAKKTVDQGQTQFATITDSPSNHNDIRRPVEDPRAAAMAIAQVPIDIDSDVPEVVSDPALKVSSQVISHTPSKLPFNVASQMQDLTPAQYGRDFVDITHSESDVEEVSKPSSYQGPVSVNSSPTSRTDIDKYTVQTTSGELLDNAFPPRPEILADAPSMLAPQPNRTSSLITSNPQILSKTGTLSGVPHTLATALREEPNPSSPESSPRRAKKGKGKSKKKTRKEKRKSAGKVSTIASPGTPYIKPEPRSPSPYVPASLPRPPKRRRPDYQPAGELDYDEPRPQVPRYESPRHAQPQQPRVQPRYVEGQSMYEEVNSPHASMRRRPHADVHYQAASFQDPYRPLQPANTYHTGYQQIDPRGRAASVVVVDEPGGSRYYREPAVRYSVRPGADRERSRSPVTYTDRRSPIMMAPPPRQRRIVVDEYGQQFYAPEPAPVRVLSRQSLAPQAYREEDVVYEQQPIRPMPRAVADTFERDGVLYRRVSPLGAPPPRRVATQPEFDTDYRQYRQREYSVRPMTLSGDGYARPLETVTRRQTSHFEGPPREYRVGSVRPDSRMSVAPVEYRPQPPSSVRAESIYGAPRPAVRRVVQAGSYDESRIVYE